MEGAIEAPNTPPKPKLKRKRTLPRPTPPIRVCTLCKETKPIECFERLQNGHWRFRCYVCYELTVAEQVTKADAKRIKTMANKARDDNFARGLKICSRCKELLPLDRFNRDRNRPTGFRYWCICCERSYFKHNRHKYLKEKRIASKITRISLRFEVLSHYSNNVTPECACCHEDCLEFLALDHIHGGGNKHKKRVRHVYKWAKQNNYPPMFRVLCHNCNQSLGAYGYCPHKAQTETAGLRVA